MLGRYAYPVVGHAESQFAAIITHIDTDFAAVRREFDRVGQQVEHHLFQTALIQRKFQVLQSGFYQSVNRYTVMQCFFFYHFQATVHQFIYVDR